MRYLTAVLLTAAALLVSGCIVYGAEAPVCVGSLDAVKQVIAENDGAKLEKLTTAEIAGIIEEYGPPPVGDYDAWYLIEQHGLAMLIMVKDDCLLYAGQPHKQEDWDKRLKRTPA